VPGFFYFIINSIYLLSYLLSLLSLRYEN